MNRLWEYFRDRIDLVYIYSLCVLLAGAAVMPVAALATDTRPATQPTQVDTLRADVAALSARVARLEATGGPTTAPASQPAATDAPQPQQPAQTTPEPQTPAQVAAAKAQAAKVANIERRIQQAEKRVEAARKEIEEIQASGVDSQIAPRWQQPSYKAGRRYYRDGGCKTSARQAANKELEAAKEQLNSLQAELALLRD
jgi:hypothetical protein